ncbi:endonuclease domain-containing protein [Stenotrophomonas nitritireducens]|uniref:endonuclease domain-containing protein n=1 Tax=Stenotrophomonas nitritireducens TaxID=83617 RepID=UPI003D981FF7
MDELRHRARQLRNNATDAERHLWRYLRNRHLGGHRFRRQMPMVGYVADFACPSLKLVIELDGGQHLQNSGYDKVRTAMLESLGYRVLRYWNDDVLMRTMAVLEDILRAIEQGNGAPPLPSPCLRQQGGDVRPPCARCRGTSRGGGLQDSRTTKTDEDSCNRRRWVPRAGAVPRAGRARA